MKQGNEKGFTLIESLFVLSTFLLIASLSLLLLRPHHSFLEKEMFFSQLKTDIFYAQHYALTSQKPVTMNFDSRKHYYYVREYNGDLLLERYFSDDITVSEGSLKLYLRFNADGNISEFGSLFIYIGDDIYRLTFLIGRGRFYVLKI